MFLRLVIFIYLIVFTTVTWGDKGEFSFDLTDLKRENFLDLKAYQWRDDQNLAWQKHQNGWRSLGGSTSYHYNYIHSQIKLRQQLSQRSAFRFTLERESFFFQQPVNKEQIALDFQLNPSFSFALLGAPLYHKAESDLGFGATLGHWPSRYIQFERMFIDPYFNEKNQTDDSRFERQPSRNRVTLRQPWGAWTLSAQWQEDSPSIQSWPDQRQRYFGEQSANLRLAYQLTPKRRLVLQNRYFYRTKELLTATSQGSQRMQHSSYDLFWVSKQQALEQTIGTRYDLFTNRRSHNQTPQEQFDETMKTWQIYHLLLYQQTDRSHFEYGVYVGNASLSRQYLSLPTLDQASQGIEAKLKLAWEYSLFPNSQFSLISTFNLDGLTQQLWDGGAMSFQSTW